MTYIIRENFMKKKSLLILIALFIFICISIIGCNSDDPVFPPEKDLNIPICYQEYNSWCGQACIEMWANYCGNYYINQTEISCDSEISDYPCSTDHGLWFCQIEYGVKKYATDKVVGEYEPSIFEADLDMIISRITDRLSVGNPSIVISSGYGDENHAIIIRGYNIYNINEDDEENDDGVPIVKDINYNDPYHGIVSEPIGDFKLDTFLPTYEYQTFSDKASGFRSYGYFYILGLGSKTAAQNLENAQLGYLEFLKRCGTYYGGPDSYIPEGSTFVRIRYPNAEESFSIGTFKEIIWESNGLTGYIRLELQKDDLVLGTIAENLQIENGSYNWEVGEYQGGSAQTGDGYKIRVSMMDDSFNDTSNLEFSICQPPTLTVTSPNGDENLKIGTYYNITWDAANITGNVKLTLLKNGSNFGPIITGIDAVDGFYKWKVGKLTNGRTVTPGSEYKIKIKLLEENVSDISDSSFNIYKKRINVTSPNGGEKWSIGSFHKIRWAAEGLTGKVKINLWKNGTEVGLIKNNINGGEYTWTVGNLIDGTTVESGYGYKIKIAEQYSVIEDFSDDSFNITNNPLPEIWLSKTSITHTVSTLDPIFYETFDIKNIGGGTLEYSVIIREGGAQYTINPTSGSSSGEIDTITITIDPTTMIPGIKTIKRITVMNLNSSSYKYIDLTTYVKPLKVSGPNPINGATNIDINKNLSWSAGNGAVKYNVYFGNDSLNFKTTTTNLYWNDTQTMYFNKLYKWRIDSVDINDKITSGDEWSFTTKQSPTAIAINLGDPDQNDHIYRFDFPMGYTEPVTITERDGSVRRTKTLDDTYMCFKVSDDWAYQGYLSNYYFEEPIPQLAITIIYLDNGTGYLNLQYDATEYEYKNGGTVDLQDTNTWMQHTFYLSDAYFGNRQNDGGDFRIARCLRGGLLYIDWVYISR